MMEKPGVSAFTVRFKAHGLPKVKYKSRLCVPRSTWMSLSLFTIISGPFQIILYIIYYILYIIYYILYIIYYILYYI